MSAHGARSLPAASPRPVPAARPARGGQRLWLALHLPSLPLEAMSDARLAHPAVAISGRDGRARVLALNEAALAAGIRPGMKSSAACVLEPGVQVVVRDEAAEEAALGWLAVWGGRFTSFVSPCPPADLLLEIGGSLRLLGDADTLTGRLTGEVGELGYTARAGVAPTAEAARLLARSADERPATGDVLATRLAPIGVEHFPLPDRTVDALRRVGVRTFGECRRLPRDDLSRRFGPGLVAMLDRALGRAPEALAPFTPPRRFERRLPFSGEVHDVETLLAAAERLLGELAGFLHARAEGARRLEWHLIHRRGPATRVALELVSASRNPTHLLGLLRERLERLELAAGVEALALRVGEVVALAPGSDDLFAGAARDEGDWQLLVEWLRARAGGEAVRGVSVRADHRPERAWAWHEAGRAPTVSAAASAPRPLWLLEHPVRLQLRDGQPWHEGRLELLHGPERVESGWWDGQDVARDYFVARGPGGKRLWIYRDLRAAGDWYLHGLFG